MHQLPKVPVMLLSYINMQLRDSYPSLKEFCLSAGADQAAIEKKLAGIDYFYRPETNQFA